MIDLKAKLEAHIAETRGKPWKARGNYPSTLGHPCDRKLYNDRDHGDQALPHSIRTLMIFGEGNLHEPALLRQLGEAGVVVVQQQCPFEDKDLAIFGKIDAMVKDNGAGLIPLEIKTCSPNAFDKFHSVDDIREADRYYYRDWLVQMLLYLYLTEHESGLILLKNKATGEVRQIVVNLDDQGLQAVENALQRAKKINHAIDTGLQPEAIPYDRSVCGECGYRLECWGEEEKFGPGAQEIPEGELLTILDERATLEEYRSKYEKLDKKAKDMIKAANVERATIGGKWFCEVTQTIREVPAQVAKQTVTVRVKIEPIDVEKE